MIQRVLRGKPATVSVTFTDQDGLPQSVTGPVDFTAQRDSTGGFISETGVVADSNYTGRYLATYAASSLQNLDRLQVTATDTASGTTETLWVDIVGGYYFNVWEARTVMGSISDTADYPDEAVIRVRAEVEAECERITGQAFVPRYTRETVSGDGSRSLLLSNPNPRRIVSISVDGTDIDTSQVVLDPVGLLHWDGTWSSGDKNVEVAYEYGWDTPPQDIKRAAITRLRERLNMANSALDPRATTYSIADGGTYSLAVAGQRGFETGNPDVDAVYARYKMFSLAG